MDFYDEGVTLEEFERIVKQLKDGEAYDLMCHPAYVDQFLYKTTSYALKRIEELDLLCHKEIKACLMRNDIRLCSYKDVK